MPDYSACSQALQLVDASAKDTVFYSNGAIGDVRLPWRFDMRGMYVSLFRSSSGHTMAANCVDSRSTGQMPYTRQSLVKIPKNDHFLVVQRLGCRYRH